MPLEFEWDPRKAASNHRKHGVTFDEAATIFGDPLAAIFTDENRLLLVSFVERLGTIRILSARQATKRERPRL